MKKRCSFILGTVIILMIFNLVFPGHPFSIMYFPSVRYFFIDWFWSRSATSSEKDGIAKVIKNSKYGMGYAFFHSDPSILSQYFINDQRASNYAFLSSPPKGEGELDAQQSMVPGIPSPIDPSKLSPDTYNMAIHSLQLRNGIAKAFVYDHGSVILYILVKHNNQWYIAGTRLFHGFG